MKFTRTISRYYGPFALDYLSAGLYASSSGYREMQQYHELNLWLSVGGHTYGVEIVWKMPDVRISGHRLMREE